jgi:threonine dehydrogenase-like Zn-dependent dehydrogenase
MTATMRAVVARSRVLGVERVPRPEPGPGEARVRIGACGICGTDLHLHHAGFPDGHTPGHEIAGWVDARGEADGGPPVGSRVAIEPLRPCGRCPTCRRGAYNVCPAVRLLGIHLPGGFAEHVVVPLERLHPVSEALAAPLAALAEPMAVAVHGLRRGGLARGERVLVLGAGAVGLLGLVAARALGARDVWISARHPQQAELARALGATRVLTEAEADPAALAAAAAETQVDLVLETVGGRANTLDAAIAAARPGGRVCVLGLFQDEIRLTPLLLLRKESSLCWSNC